MSVQGAPTDLADAGKRYTWAASIPADYVDTRGVDYFFHVKDGHTEAFWPGTTHVGYYVPLDGQRVTWHHVHVVEPPHIVHAPVTSSPYRADVPITANANCPATRTCTATLYYRTTTSGILDPAPAFTAATMGVTKIATAEGTDLVKVDGTIPGSVADTRGVDYFFSVHDGVTTSWYPGTSHADGYVPVEGTRVGYQHVRVLEPPQVVAAHVPVAPALQDLTVDADVTCATEYCDVYLSYTSDLEEELLTNIDARFVKRPMTEVGTVASTPAGRVSRYRATVPAAQVTTRGLSYFIEAHDGYTTAFSPGSSYAGAYVVTDGSRLGCVDSSTTQPGERDGSGPLYAVDGTLAGCVSQLGAHVVRVLESPHTLHVPIAVADTGVEQRVEARSNCSTPACTATLHWRPTYGEWKSVSMTTTRLEAGALGFASLDQHVAAIPASDVKIEGFQYRLEVTDGYVTDSTLTHAPLMRGEAGANYPPGVPDYPDPADNSVIYATPAQLAVRYLDPEGMPGTVDIELLDTMGAVVASGSTSQAVSNTRATFAIPALANGAYRWRARARDDLGAVSPWTSYWTFALVNNDDCSRFVALWAPRVQDDAWVKALRAAEGYPADIVSEGFHALDEGYRRALVDCLHNYLHAVEPLDPEITASDVDFYKDLLYKLIFDKTSITDPVEQALGDGVPQIAQAMPAEATNALQKISGIDVPDIPAGLEDQMGELVPAMRDLVPEPLLAQHGLETVALPEAAGLVEQAHQAGSILPAAQQVAHQVMGDERLPVPVVDPFEKTLRTALQLTTYRACYESPTKSTTCTGLTPRGTAVPADVTGDGTLDVLLQLTPIGDDSNPLGVTVQLSAQRLVTSEMAPGTLRAHVWFVHDVAFADKRVRVGFDGMHRGAALAERTELTFTVKEPLAVFDSNLLSHYKLRHTSAPPQWAMTVGSSRIVAPDEELDPLVASVQFTPVPASMEGDFDAVSTDTAGSRRSDIRFTTNSSQPSVIDALMAAQRNSVSPVRQDVARFLVDQLPTVASVEFRQEEIGDRQTTKVVSDNNSLIANLQATRVVTPDITHPDTYDILAGHLLDVPTHAEATINEISDDMTVNYLASSSMTRATVANLGVANNALDRAALLQADGIPTRMDVTAGPDADAGFEAHYNSSGSLAKLLALYFNAASGGTVFVGRAENLPTRIDAIASAATRKVSIASDGPIGAIDIKGSRNGGGVLPLPGDHATVIATTEGTVASRPLGFSAVIHGLEDLSLAMNAQVVAHTKVVPGGQPFTALAFLNNRELALMQVSNLPSVIEITAAMDAAAPSATYRASDRVEDVVVYYTDFSDGPTFAAALAGVPSSIDLTATLSNPPKLTYSADTTLDQLVVFASPNSALKLDTATTPYIIGIVQEVPASIEAVLDLNGQYSWNASGPVPLVVLAARGIEPLPADVGVVIGATGVPAQFDGNVNLANRSFSFRGITGPIGRAILMATNHRSVTTFAGNHIHGYFDQRNGQWDVSASIGNVWSASAVVNSDLKTYRASLSADLQGQPFILDVNYVRNPGIQLAVQGIVRNFPSWIEAGLSDGKLTYRANANVDLAMRAHAGWIAALNATPAPPWVLGVAVRDGSCTDGQGCPRTSNDFCRSGKCLALKAAVYATGMPTEAVIDLDANRASLSNYRPSAGLNWFTVYADIRHVVSTPFVTWIQQEGIPSGVDIAMDLKFLKRVDSRPAQYGFNMASSHPMGRLWGIGAALGALGGQDVLGFFDFRDVGTRVGLAAALGGKTEIQARTNTAAPTNLTIYAQTVLNGAPAQAGVWLEEIPAEVDLTLERSPGEGFQIPTISYLGGGSSNSSSLDGLVYVHGKLTFDVADAPIEVHGRVLAGFTNLGRDTRALVDAAGRVVNISSTPATTQLFFNAAFKADTGRFVIDPTPSSKGAFRWEIDGAIDLGPSSVDNAWIVMNTVGIIDFGWLFPISFTVRGSYDSLVVVLDKVRVRLDEAWAKVKVSANAAGRTWYGPSLGMNVSGRTVNGMSVHLMRADVAAPIWRASLGPLCAEIRTLPRPTRVGQTGANGVSGMIMYGSEGTQEVWFNPGGMIPQVVGNVAVAKALSQAPRADATVNRC